MGKKASHLYSPENPIFLHMRLTEHISTAIQTKINSLFSKAKTPENPETILEQPILKMQADLAQLREAVTSATAEQQRTEREYTQAQHQAREWQRWVPQALEGGDENQAWQALERQKNFAETVNTLKTSLEEQTVHINSLKSHLTTLEYKITEAHTKKEMLKAQFAALKAQQQIHRTLERLETSSAIATSDLIEEKFSRVEDFAEAQAEVVRFELHSQNEQTASENHFECEVPAINIQLSEPPLIEGDEFAASNVQLLELSVFDWQEKLEVLRQALIQEITSQKRIQRQYNQADKEAKKWETRAQIGLIQHKEASVQEVIQRSETSKKTAFTLQVLLEQHTARVDALKHNLMTLKSKILQTQVKQDLLKSNI